MIFITKTFWCIFLYIEMYPAIVVCNDCFEWDEYRKEIVRVKSGLWDLQCLVYILY